MKKFIIPGFFILFILAASIFTAVNVFDVKIPFIEGLFNGKQEDVTQLPPEFEFDESERKVHNPSTDVLITSSEDLSLRDGASAAMAQIGSRDATKYYILTISDIANGKSIRRATIQNSSGGTKEIEISISRDMSLLPLGYTSIDPWPKAQYILDPDDLLAPVDKEHKVFEDYVPDDLVDLNKEFGIYTLNDARLRRDAAVSLNQMWNAVGEAVGEYPTIVSGYRSFSSQFELHVNYIKNFGETEALTFSAKPGFSEHQLATTIDVSIPDLGSQLTTDFADTPAGVWLNANSEKYGYVMTYPKSAESITGYYEPWHFRYIGIENANAMRESGKSFYEWVETLDKQ